MVDKQEILRLLNQYFTTTGEITIDDSGLVSCNGRVALKQETTHTRLPVSFDRVDADFWCHDNQLATLEGAPKSVGGDFYCDGNQLTTLEGAPNSVFGHFYCDGIQLISLTGAPNRVGGAFHCSYNQLTTLEGSPNSVGSDFHCSYNQLISLDGAPNSVGGDFWCDSNQLTSLEHAPQSVGGDFGCSLNTLASLQHLPVVQGTLTLSYSPTLPLLRCLLAQKIAFYPYLPDKTLETILNHYAGQGRAGAIDCKRELVSAGFEENARW